MTDQPQEHLHGYSHPFALGHKAVKTIWDGTVEVTEKIDGSQFSFGLRNDVLICRSRKVEVNQVDPGMFKLAVETAQDLAIQGLLGEGITYRGEFLSKPKHNTLAYERVPRGNIILFDVDRGLQDYVSHHGLMTYAAILDLECVPLLGYFKNKVLLKFLEEMLEGDSILGGQREGIVLKNYELFGPDNKVLMAKMVSKDFQEKHQTDWKNRNPGKKQFIEIMIDGLATEPRWMKAVQHLREQDMIEGVPQDIPEIMAEIAEDVEKEMRVEIQDSLYNHFWPEIRRGLTRGFPEWYKRLLAEESLDGP